LRFVADDQRRTVQMIVIGADAHKRTPAPALVDAPTGRLRDSRRIKAERRGISRRASSTSVAVEAGAGLGIARRAQSRPLVLH
jgi:hypothetical protein